MDSKKNTAWFFGDSFTQMACIKNGAEYQKFTNKKDITSWTTYVAQYLDANEVVIAQGGRAPEQIYFSCLDRYQNIKEGDWIFITDSPYVRQVGVDLHNKNVISYNNEMLIHSTDNPFTGDTITHGIPVHSMQDKTILLDYINTFILPYKEIWESYWRNNIINLVNIFRTKNVNVMFWSYKLWLHFTSIQEETSNKIPDFHWGEIGNIEFFNYIKQRIDNKEWVSEKEWK